MQLINDFHDICSFVFKLLYFDCFGGFVCFGWRLFGFPFWKGGVLYLLGFFLWMFWNFEEFTRFANTKLCLLNEIIFTNPYLHVLLLKTIHQQKNQLLKKKTNVAHWPHRSPEKQFLVSFYIRFFLTFYQYIFVLILNTSWGLSNSPAVTIITIQNVHHLRILALSSKKLHYCSF